MDNVVDLDTRPRLYKVKHWGGEMMTNIIEKETTTFVWVENPIRGRKQIDKRLKSEFHGWCRTPREAALVWLKEAQAQLEYHAKELAEVTADREKLKVAYAKVMAIAAPPVNA